MIFLSDISIEVVIPSFSNSLLISSIFKVLILSAACSPASNINTVLAASVTILLQTSTYDSRNLPVSYTHLRAHETKANLVCRLLLEKNKKTHKEKATSKIKDTNKKQNIQK